MFLKITKSGKNRYLQIVKSYRDKGKVKHKVIASLGNLELLLNDNVSKRLLEILSEKSDDLFSLSDINQKDKADVYCFASVVLKKIWNSYKLNEFFSKLLESRKIEFDIIKNIFYLVINRTLASYASKLGFFNSKDYFLIDEMKLQDLYKTLDFLSEIKEDLEEHLLKKSIDLFNRDITVGLYDVTTLYFESQKSDNLREFGLSKDFKMNDVQIVLGLLTDRDGIPISFDIYKGNTSESHTILDSLDRIKNRFGINKITIVADRGISNFLNLYEIRKRGYDYIVALRFKNSKELEEKILTSLDEYRTISFTKENGFYGYKEFIITQTKRKKVDNQYKDITLTHKIIATYSDKRARKDKSDRDRKIEKLLKNPTVKKSKFIKSDCNTYSIDFEKVKEDEAYDGFYAIAASDLEIDPKEAINIHKNLYEIENSFRENKHTLNIRPIRHFKEERIIGHVIASFLGYFILKQIQVRLKRSKKVQHYLNKSNETLSLDKILDALLHLRVVKVDIKSKDYFIKLSYPTLSSKILDLFKIKVPKKITSKEEFYREYLTV